MTNERARIDLVAIGLELMPLVATAMLALIVAVEIRTDADVIDIYWLLYLASVVGGLGWLRVKASRWQALGCAYGVGRAVSLLIPPLLIVVLALEDLGRTDEFGNYTSGEPLPVWVAFVLWLAVLIVAPIVSAVLVGFISARSARPSDEGATTWQHNDAPR